MRRPVAPTPPAHAHAALLVAMVLALVSPPAAGAAGIGLRWNSCKGEANRTFACDRSTGSEVLVGSFVSPETIPLSGVEVYMRISTPEGNLPAWWQMAGAGRCRATSLSASFDVSAESECDDPWMGQAGGGVAWYDTRSPANWPGQGSGGVYLKMAMAVPSAAIQQVSGGRHYAAFKLLINHSLSSGPGACEGCSTPACLTIEVLRLTSPDPNGDPNQVSRNFDIELTGGITGMNGGNIAMWQGGTPTCGAGAAKSSTWAEVKRRFK